MKIKLLQTVHVPSLPEMAAGETYFVSDEIGAMLVERDQAEEVKTAPQETLSKPAEKKADK